MGCPGWRRMQAMSERDIASFFDELSSDYLATIQRCFPRYREMLCTLVDSLPRTNSKPKILDLGCGTGNLAVLLHKVFPAGKFHLVDLSEESLETCRLRLPTDCNAMYTTANMADVDFPERQFDMVVSSIAIHHLPTEGEIGAH